MDPIPCACCGGFFIPRNRRQKFCSKPACQKARKAIWHKQKMATDPDYRKGQRLANQKWHARNPDYWKKYRRKNPDKAARNRALQRIRNQRKEPEKVVCIAKMDVRKARNQSLIGQFWLVPAIAKIDPIKIFITTAPGCSR